MTAPLDFVTITHACRIAKVSRRTIYNWLKIGKLRYTRTVGGSVRIDPTSLFTAPPARSVDRHASAS